MTSQWLINMVKRCPSNLNNVWARLPCSFLLDPLKRDFLGIDLSMFLGVRNFGNTAAMKVIFFWKCSKFKLDLKNEEKNWQKAFYFRDNDIWICCVKLSLARREYLPLAHSVLENSFEISDITNRNFLSDHWLPSD